MTTTEKHVEVAIVGAGFGGIGTAIALKKAGFHDLIIFEGEDNVGGSWLTNQYPGCGCDVPSHLYSYSFEPKPDWPEAYSKQDDIQRYIEHCANKYHVMPHIRFNTRVDKAEFNEKNGYWTVAASTGDVWKAKVLVTATGALSHPKYPDIPGIDQFEGDCLHAARWDHSIDLRNKRVGVVGTGASAIQIIPSIAPDVKELLVFQRTPAWVLPKMNRRYSDKDHQRWRKHPFLQKLSRSSIYWTMEAALPAIMWFPKLLRLGEFAHKRQLKKAIKDPILRQQLTPKYRVGCKRTLVSDDYFPTFARSNVKLIDEPVNTVDAHSVSTGSGQRFELDALIFATGYDISKPAYPFDIIGLGNQSLSDYWGEQPKAYFGMSVSGFPNLLLIMGPNTGPGHTSVLLYQEAQYQYVVKYVERLRRKNYRYLDVDEAVQNTQFAAFQARMKNSSWLSGCNSWYLNADGSNSTMWPGFSFEYKWKMRKFREQAYSAAHDNPISDRFDTSITQSP